MKDSIKIGVLALQGDFAEHAAALNALGVEVVEIRRSEQLADIDGLIIPGGESTTIGKLAVDFNMIQPLHKFGSQKPIWGTCAGAIFISKDAKRDQPLLHLMDISIERNAFGRQADSFVQEIDIPVLNSNNAVVNQAFQAVFIRAPIIAEVSGDAETIATLDDGRIVAVQQGHMLATSFHPELTDDYRFHEYFLSLVRKNLAKVG